jgi:hypothetical protein
MTPMARMNVERGWATFIRAHPSHPRFVLLPVQREPNPPKAKPAADESLVFRLVPFIFAARWRSR